MTYYAHPEYDCDGDIVGSYHTFYMGAAQRINVLKGWFAENEDGIKGPFKTEQDAIKSVTCFI